MSVISSILSVDNIIKRAHKFPGERWSLDRLKQIIRERYTKAQKYSIIMGFDNNLEPQWWIVTNREASILKKHGFEVAY